MSMHRAKRAGMSARQRRRALEGYLYLSPWILGFFAFTAGPIVFSLAVSFTKYNVLTAPEFIGLKNYIHAFGGDPLVLPSFGRSFYYALVSVPLGLAGSLLAAMLLNQGLRLVAVWRACFFLPTLTPTVAAAILWRWLLNSDIGMVNHILNQVGLQGPKWFASTEWAIPGLILIGLWGSIGGATMIIFLAGLQGVPKELLEAAEIDGAGRLAKFWHITLPMISPVVLFNLIIGVIGALRVFDIAFVATRGGPANATWFISLHIYKTAFLYFDMGYASALAWMLTLLILVITYIQFRLSGRWVFYHGVGR